MEKFLRVNDKGQITIPGEIANHFKDEETLYFVLNSENSCYVTKKGDLLSEQAEEVGVLRSRNRITIPNSIRTTLLDESSKNTIKLNYDHNSNRIQLHKMLSTPKRSALSLELYTMATRLESTAEQMKYAANKEDVEHFYSSLHSLIKEAESCKKQLDY